MSWGASKSNGLNKIANIDYGSLCLKAIDLSFNQLYYLEL